MFPVWSTTVTAMLLPELINWEAFCKVIESAGNVGIGNGRKIGDGRLT